MGEEVYKFSKRGFYFIVILVVVSGAFYVNSFYSGSDEEVEEFKNALYESISCQYSCPVEEYELTDRTEVLLGDRCVGECISQLELKGYEREEFSVEDLTNDDFALDLDNLLNDCRQEHIDEDGVPDNQKFYDCVNVELGDLKGVYSYLG